MDLFRKVCSGVKSGAAWCGEKVEAVVEKVGSGLGRACAWGIGILGVKYACGSAMAAEATLPAMPIDFDDLITQAMEVINPILTNTAMVVIVIALCSIGLTKLIRSFRGRA